jgi:hypothetical protein
MNKEILRTLSNRVEVLNSVKERKSAEIELIEESIQPVREILKSI